jgi:putative transposase
MDLRAMLRRPVAIHRKIESALARHVAGETIGQICRELKISRATWYRWKSRYAQQRSCDMVRLQELEVENAQLKKEIGLLRQEVLILRKVLEGNV